jgi:L-aspartate oxidase
MRRRQVELDVLVVGSGVAGLSAVVRLASAPGAKVGVLTKAELSQSATRWAQGGIAAVLGGDEDSTDLHLADTLAAGAGLCDIEAVRVLVDEGPRRVSELIALGAVFDRESGGDLARAREGGHSTARVLHAGGAATGAEVERALVSAVRASAAAVLEGWFALDLVVSGGSCRGVLALDPHGSLEEVRADQVVLATGGAGQLYAVTTNPHEATGDGTAMALRAGVPVADVEFMQFHPTALHHPAMPRPLLSEALRGHGAILRDAAGERFVDELAPRDLVSRLMAARMKEQGVDHLWLDATGLEGFDDRFPTLASSLREAGLDPAVDWLPIAPAAHYVSGGVLTDLDGASAMSGLWAAGETACTGVHGANRLASNSLLEGMVFGARLAEAIDAGKGGPSPTGAMRALLEREPSSRVAEPVPPAAPSPGTSSSASSSPGPSARATSSTEYVIGCRYLERESEDPAPSVQTSSSYADSSKLRERLQDAMTQGAGVLRSPDSLRAAAAVVDEVRSATTGSVSSRAEGELKNLTELARALLRAATAREETRGAHARVDHPETESAWRVRIVHRPAATVGSAQPGGRGSS